MPKIVDHEQYRKELLCKCFDLFAQKGYGSITMRQLAEGMGVSTGTLYHYFPSKKALFEQLVEEVSKQDVLMAEAEFEGATTLQERTEALGKYLSNNEDYYVKWMYVYVDFCQHKDSQDVRNKGGFQRANEIYQKAIYDFLGIQDIRLAGFIYTFMDGLIMERLCGNELVSIPEQCTLLGKMLTIYLDQKIKF
jgi:AcrR family transcriptional regulator